MTAIIPTELLKELYDQGMTLRELAEQSGFSVQAIQQRLSYHGIPRRPKSMRRLTDTRCAFCGITFRPRAHDTRYCSKQCYGLAHRRTLCKHGHLLAGDNLLPRMGKTGPRCKACAYAAHRSYLQRRKARDERPA